MTALRLSRSALVLLLVLVSVLPLHAAKLKPASTPKIDPKAAELLRQMSDYLHGLQSFSVHVETTRDLVLPSDQALSSDLAYDLMVRRPDRFRVNMTSAAGDAEVFYNGKTMTVFTPKKNYYAVTPAPATIEETIMAAMKRGISMPLADLIYRNPNRQLLANVTSATFVGSSLVEGAMTNHLAFRQKGIDWQIWIEDGPAPLPRKIMIVDRGAKDFPRFVATLSDWNTNPALGESTFMFVPPEGARQINFGQLPRQPRNWGKSAPTR